MKTLTILAILALVIPAAAIADEHEGSEIAIVYKTVTEPVTYKSGADDVRGYIIRPDAKGTFPGVIAIHEWYGLNEWVTTQAKKIAEHGYVVLAIDLYRGSVATNSDDAHELMRGLPEDRATRDLQTAVEYLRSLKQVKKDKIGSIGWCMGGSYSLQAALAVPDLAACVICYGRLVTEDETITQINAPVLGIFGADDLGIPAESVKKFENQANELGRKVTTHIYEKSGHAFMRESNEKGYNAEATADAWKKILAFFENTLQEKKKK